MQRVFLILALLALTSSPVWAQSPTFSSSYTLFSTGTDSTYSGTIDASTALPAGFHASGFFDHLEGDKSYVEASVGVDVPSGKGFTGVYEVQDSVDVDLQHLVGVGYHRSAGSVNFVGKFFPYSTADATDYAAEVSASTSHGSWTFKGFVDVLRDSVVDDTQWFSKSQAVRVIVPHVDFVGEYRWERDYLHTDRSIWFGLNIGL
jgi:hypothetical protein